MRNSGEMMKKKAGFCACPGTAGEFIQGIYKDEPCLVSNPVSMFSYTLASLDEEASSHCGEKQREALNLYLDEKGYAGLKDRIFLSTKREMPLMKGMASSTADICSAVGACASLIGEEIEETLLKEICIEIEPSDNLMFKDLNLMNHYSGRIFERYQKSVSCPVLILDFDKAQSTEEFGYEREFQKDIGAFQEAVELFRSGVKSRNLVQIGKACTKSATINQSSLYREELPSILREAQRSGAYGICVGHSGSVITVLCAPAFQASKFLQSIAFHKDITAVYQARLIPGGVRRTSIRDVGLSDAVRLFKDKTGMNYQKVQ